MCWMRVLANVILDVEFCIAIQLQLEFNYFKKIPTHEVHWVASGNREDTVEEQSNWCPIQLGLMMVNRHILYSTVKTDQRQVIFVCPVAKHKNQISSDLNFCQHQRFQDFQATLFQFETSVEFPRTMPPRLVSAYFSHRTPRRLMGLQKSIMSQFHFPQVHHEQTHVPRSWQAFILLHHRKQSSIRGVSPVQEHIDTEAACAQTLSQLSSPQGRETVPFSGYWRRQVRNQNCYGLEANVHRHNRMSSYSMVR